MVSDPSFETRVYQLSDDTQIFSYTANTAIMKWVLFGDDEFFTVSADNTIKRFIDDGFGSYTLDSSTDTTSLGSPTCLNLNIDGLMLVSMDD